MAFSSAMGDFEVRAIRKLLAIAAFMATACTGSAQLVLKSPIQDRCKDGGLRGCDDLTDGLLLYVDGNHEEAETKIRRGASKNEPAKLREFAENIRLLKGLPGADEYAKPLFQAADLLVPAEREHARTEGRGDDESAKGAPPAADAPLSHPIHGLAGSVVPSAEGRAYACQLNAEAPWGLDPEAVVGRCVNVAAGPAILTDMQTTGACHDLLVVGVGNAQKPRWILIAEPSSVLAVHSGRYWVEAGETVFVGQAGATASSLNHGEACVVTWAIER